MSEAKNPREERTIEETYIDRANGTVYCQSDDGRLYKLTSVGGGRFGWESMPKLPQDDYVPFSLVGNADDALEGLGIE